MSLAVGRIGNPRNFPKGPICSLPGHDRLFPLPRQSTLYPIDGYTEISLICEEIRSLPSGSRVQKPYIAERSLSIFRFVLRLTHGWFYSFGRAEHHPTPWSPVFSNPTIKDVARVAGVHFTTVSMALRGHPSIPPTTRDRIVAAAGRIGYQRDSVFSALSNRRSRAETRNFAPGIAYVVNRSPENGYFRRSHYRMLVEGARKQAEALGYRFEMLVVDEDHHDSSTLYDHLKKHGFTGLIIGAFEPGRAVVELDWTEFCVVKIDSRHMHPPVTFISTDQFNGVRSAVKKMRMLGYSRVGLAVGIEDEEGTDDMHLSGFLLEQPEVSPRTLIPPLFFPRGAVAEDAIPLVRSWIQNNAIDAVVCNWTNIRTMITEAGFRCPEDVACACLCLGRRNASLAGMVANMDLVGQRGAALLATLMRSERRGIPSSATTTYVQGNWYDGTSAPPRH